MRFLVSALAVFGCAVSVSGPVSTVDAQCLGDKVGATAVPAKGGTPSANALPLFYTFNQNSGAMTNAFRSNGLGGLAGADFFCNYEADAARFGTALLQQRKGLFKAVMSNRLTDAVDRFNAVNELTNGGTVHDVVDANNQCLTSSVDQLFFEGWNFNQALPDGRGNYAAANAIIDNFTGSLTDFTKWKVPTGTENTSENQVLNNAYCSTSTSASDQGWTSTTGTTRVGRIFSTTNNAEGDWISATDVGCTNGLHILCMQAAATPTTTPGGTGDPQFTGLQGQQFQVHGMPDEYFNLISSPDMQLNSRFAYLASGRCNYNNTECWTHPGTYVDQLGFMFPGLTIKAISGSHQDGMTVYVNEKRITTTTTNTHHTIHSHQHHDINTTQTVTITYTQNDQLIVTAPLFTITATNSDMFFNFGVSMHSPSLLSSGSALHHISDKSAADKYPSFPLHGLLGQTWKNARYSHGRMFAGTVDDYMLLDSKLISNKFVYNQYKH